MIKWLLIFVLLLQGCEGLGIVNARAENAMDDLIILNETILCEKITKKKKKKRYGNSEERKHDYENFCNGGFSPTKED